MSSVISMLTEGQFERLRRFALGRAGILLEERHRETLGDRSARMARGGQGIFLDQLLTAADQGDESADRILIELLTTNHTGYFRVPWHFDIAVEHAIWAVNKKG